MRQLRTSLGSILRVSRHDDALYPIVLEYIPSTDATGFDRGNRLHKPITLTLSDEAARFIVRSLFHLVDDL